MNFSEDGSDTWDSTPAQEIFIRNYFTNIEPLNVTKKSRKRKKHPPSSDTASSSVMSNYLEKKTSNEMPKVKNSNKKSRLISPASLESSSAKCNNAENETRRNFTTNFVNKSLEKNFNVFKSSKTGNPKIKKFSQKSSKNETSDCKKEFQNDVNMTDKSSKIDLQNNNSPSKKVNLKKNKSNIGQTSQIQNMSSVAESNFKMKTIKNTSCSNKIYINRDDSDDFKNKVIQSRLLNLKKRQLKKINNLQNLNTPTSKSNFKTKILKATKNTSNPKENYFNSEDEITQGELQNLKKRKSKTSKASQIDESVDSEDEVFQSKPQNKNKSKTIQSSQINKSEDSEDEVTQSELQTLKKRKSKINKASQIKNKSSATKSNFQTKQVKNIKNTSKSKENHLNVNDSDVSEEDEVIRSELQNTRMYMKIQKLMKLAPHLNPNFVKDSVAETNNSSYDEISTENSSSESDGECSSEGDNEVPKRDSPGGHSEDSLNSKEDDSSENEEKYIGSQESHQTTSKQEIPVQRLETCSQKTSNVKKPNSLIEKARAKLAAAKFRFLNEKLYTESGGEAFRYFQENKDEFEDYHLGYGQQVSKWPLNPVDGILVDLQKMKKRAVIADLGCGDAKIARVLNNRVVHSFDLVAKHTCVTACDMSRVPLPDSSVDVAVFCLSLMGVNLLDYLREAYRILKIGGTLKIAEVESRIENLDLFIASLNSLGFVLERKNTKNKLFVFLDLKKGKKGKASKAPTITLRPCLYKKR